jgi:hypothetical protein
MDRRDARPWDRGVVVNGLKAFLANDEQRLAAMARLIAGSMLLCMTFSGTLWFSTRQYPLTPLLGIVPPFPEWLDTAVVFSLAGLLSAVLVWPLARLPVAVVVGLLLILFAQDQSRLWPSFYTSFLMFLLLLGHDRGGQRAAGHTLAGMRFAFAAIYFWGGFQKLTQHFFWEEFPWFIQPLTNLVPLPETWIPAIGVAAAVFEMVFALGLLTTRFRRLALWEALAMHAVILICIGPLRGHWNDSAWVWSLTMAAQVWLLFYAAPPFEVAAMLAGPPGSRVARALVFLLVGIMPALNSMNRWDSALSFNIYSGNVNVGSVVMRPDAVASLPPAVAAHVTHGDNWAMLPLNAWAMSEFNAGTYPEKRVFRRLFAAICGWIPPGSGRLVIVEKATWVSPKTTHQEGCESP